LFFFKTELLVDKIEKIGNQQQVIDNRIVLNQTALTGHAFLSSNIS
jgi:hypothetical protein